MSGPQRRAVPRGTKGRGAAEGGGVGGVGGGRGGTPPPCPGTGNVRLWNQGLVLGHDRGQPCTAGKKFSGALRRGMRALSFPTLNHIDK